MNPICSFNQFYVDVGGLPKSLKIKSCRPLSKCSIWRRQSISCQFLRSRIFNGSMMAWRDVIMNIRAQSLVQSSPRSRTLRVGKDVQFLLFGQFSERKFFINCFSFNFDRWCICGIRNSQSKRLLLSIPPLLFSSRNDF